MPLFIIIITPIVALVLSFSVKKKADNLGWVALAASIIELLASLAVVAEVVRTGSYSWTPYLSVDPLGAIMIIVLALIGFAASWYSIGYLRTEVAKKIIGFHRVKQYFILLNLFLLAMYFAIITTNPILMWIAIEATTLSTAFLISFYNKPSAMEAAWKYLIINSVGLLLAFFGTLLFLYPSLSAGHTGLINWHTILSNVSTFNPLVAKTAFIFVLIGYGTKVGLVPMHTWRPDTYSKAPIPIVALFSSALLNIAFFAILRFKAVTDLTLGTQFSQGLLLFIGLISILLAAFSIFGQKNYKRLLAYSSIEHAGIMALGFGFGGIGAVAALLHMVYHSLVKSFLFLSSGNIFLKYSSTKMAKVKNMLKILPVTSIIFVIGFLAITGVPPFGIFVTEFSILSAGIHAHPAIVITALLGMVLVFVGFLKHTVSMMYGEGGKDIPQGEVGAWTIAPIMFLLIIFVISSFFIPQAVRLLLNSAF